MKIQFLKHLYKLHLYKSFGYLRKFTSTTRRAYRLVARRSPFIKFVFWRTAFLTMDDDVYSNRDYYTLSCIDYIFKRVLNALIFYVLHLLSILIYAELILDCAHIVIASHFTS